MWLQSEGNIVDLSMSSDQDLQDSQKKNRDSSGQGIWLFVRTRSAMKGATIPPILAIHEHDPIPAFLTTVGNSSAEY